MTLRTTRLLSVVALVSMTWLTAPTSAWAQETMQTEDPLKADLKGAIGLGLIGAELGFVVPALVGARDAWAFIVFPVLGAAGGAVGGYFLLEKDGGKPEAAVAVLVAGMALVVPAVVITVAATAYEPEDELGSDQSARDAQAAVAAGPGLVRLSQRGLLLAPPAVVVGPEGDVKAALRTGVPREHAVRVALLSGQF